MQIDALLRHDAGAAIWLYLETVDLCALCLVCQTLSKRVVPELYRHVDLQRLKGIQSQPIEWYAKGSLFRRQESFCFAIIENPRLHSLVKGICWFIEELYLTYYSYRQSRWYPIALRIPIIKYLPRPRRFRHDIWDTFRLLTHVKVVHIETQSTLGFRVFHDMYNDVPHEMFPSAHTISIDGIYPPSIYKSILEPSPERVKHLHLFKVSNAEGPFRCVRLKGLSSFSFNKRDPCQTTDFEMEEIKQVLMDSRESLERIDLTWNILWGGQIHDRDDRTQQAVHRHLLPLFTSGAFPLFSEFHLGGVAISEGLRNALESGMCGRPCKVRVDEE